ncbi:hypothetical protein [Bosea thiooxidans]
MSARSTLGQSTRNFFASGVCAFALLVPLEGQADWQKTIRYEADGETVTFRRIKPLNFAISELPDGPAPANDCPGLAFEIANPKAGEARCVGYLARRR